MEHDGVKLCPTDRDFQVQRHINLDCLDVELLEGERCEPCERYKKTQIMSAMAPVGKQVQDANDTRNFQIQPHMTLLGPENTVTTCQFCHASIKTAVKYTTTSRTHMAAALWGMICCLCCVPYGCESAKNTDHYCPACQRYIGTYVK